VNSAIVTADEPVYRAGMRSVFLRLLAFLAVALMPFGMAAAPAASEQHQEMAMTMPVQHCPEPDTSRHSKAALADCTMACASALPATDLEAVGAHPISRFIHRPTPIVALSGICVEIATPPPRLS
jgi:hypothetical protein